MNNETKQETVLGITPGQWVVMEFNGERCPFSIITDSDEVHGNVICNSPERSLTASLQYWPANAKLIAAAPEMYEALKNIVMHEEGAGLFDKLMGDNASGHDLGQSKELGELISKIKLLLKKATD